MKCFFGRGGHGDEESKHYLFERIYQQKITSVFLMRLDIFGRIMLGNIEKPIHLDGGCDEI